MPSWPPRCPRARNDEEDDLEARLGAAEGFSRRASSCRRRGGSPTQGAPWPPRPDLLPAKITELRAAEVAVLEMQGLRIYADSKLVNTVMNPITRTKLDGAYMAGAVAKRLP
jgi:hypothetical protein